MTVMQLANGPMLLELQAGIEHADLTSTAQQATAHFGCCIALCDVSHLVF